MKLIEVTWRDANVSCGWHSAGSPVGLSLLHSCGWLVEENDEFLTLASGWTVSNGWLEYNHRTTIPSGWVEEIVEWTEVDDYGHTEDITAEPAE